MGAAERAKMVEGSTAVDWGMAEALAFGSLLVEGVAVRLTGQDTVRGTFSHRHAAFTDTQTGQEWAPLSQLSEGAKYEIYDSPLSEAGALGFEYGYSVAAPSALVLWEAQFGDFINAAQVIVDQFIASAEDKWGYLNGLVLLLPHGFEGMGAEHSSARLERFLMLAAQDNIVGNCPFTDDIDPFHLLERLTDIPCRALLYLADGEAFRLCRFLGALDGDFIQQQRFGRSHAAVTELVDDARGSLAVAGDTLIRAVCQYVHRSQIDRTTSTSDRQDDQRYT